MDNKGNTGNISNKGCIPMRSLAMYSNYFVIYHQLMLLPPLRYICTPVCFMFSSV